MSTNTNTNTAFTATANDATVVANMRGDSFDRLNDAATIATRLDETDVSIRAYVKAANLKGGETNASAGLTRITNLVALVRGLITNGLDPRDHKRSLAADTFAGLVIRASAGNFGQTKGVRGVSAADIMPELFAIIADHATADTPLKFAALTRELTTRADEIAAARPVTIKRSTDDAAPRTRVAKNDDGSVTSAPDQADDNVAPIVDVAAHLKRAMLALKDVESADAAQIKSLVAMVHAMGDALVEIPTN